ncbi:MAG: response regulator [Actinobacteria bacterium]|nr:response regulator [Actinomycetota bacterium]
MNPKSANILIVDDDRFIRASLEEILTDAGYNIKQAADGKTALDILAQESFDLMLLDLDLPRVPGMEVLRRSFCKHPELGVVIVSGKGTVQNAVEATKLGAFDFIEKPLEVQRTLLTVRNAVEKTQLLHQRNRLVEEVRVRYKMVGSSPQMQQIYRMIDKAATTQSKVLITGENGTGKELIARAIHHNSERAGGPFVPVNCAAIAENLIESELFGHTKGAFTGAHTAHRGKFEQAHTGTLFLDEVADMSLMMQAKVLRVLEDGIVNRVGGEKETPVDVRILSATNKDIDRELLEGNLREDLYYRLNVITIRVPPLRDRKEDIYDLVHYFLDHFCNEEDASPKTLAAGAMAIFLEEKWPGNVRQLKNAVERLVVLSDNNEISAQAAADAVQKTKTRQPKARYTTLRQARQQFEKEFILNTLISHEWKILETAHTLGIERSHLWKKMKRYGIGKK